MILQLKYKIFGGAKPETEANNITVRVAKVFK